MNPRNKNILILFFVFVAITQAIAQPNSYPKLNYKGQDLPSFLFAELRPYQEILSNKYCKKTPAMALVRFNITLSNKIDSLVVGGNIDAPTKEIISKILQKTSSYWNLEIVKGDEMDCVFLLPIYFSGNNCEAASISSFTDTSKDILYIFQQILRPRYTYKVLDSFALYLYNSNNKDSNLPEK